MIKTLIVDDEKLARDLLARFVDEDPELTLVGRSSDGQQAMAAIDDLKPELVFLDIQMPLMDGLAVAKRIQSMAQPPYVIFVTAFDRYATQAFEHHALDYVLKPVDKSRLQASIQRAKTAIDQKNIVAIAQRMTAMVQGLQNSSTTCAPEMAAPEDIVITIGQQLISLKQDDIIWIEAANQYVKIHTLEQMHMMSENLSQFSQRLEMTRFLRVHRSALINLSKLVSVARKGNGAHKITLQGGFNVVLSRGRADLLPQLLQAI